MSTLSLLLSSGVRAEIFRLLLGVGTEELHVREFQRQCGFSLTALRQELKLLQRLGLVVSRVSGNRRTAGDRGMSLADAQGQTPATGSLASHTTPH